MKVEIRTLQDGFDVKSFLLKRILTDEEKELIRFGYELGCGVSQKLFLTAELQLTSDQTS